MGRLTTHVLDTVHGGPARGVVIELHAVSAEGRRLLAQATTNADGRTDAPLLEAGRLRAGVYELTFHIGDYFGRRDSTLPDPPFLDRVPVRFAIADPAGHYHVPLIASPWSYATYRGS